MCYFEGVMNFKARPPSASQPKIRYKGQGLIVANATKRYDKPATISPARATPGGVFLCILEVFWTFWVIAQILFMCKCVETFKDKK